MRAFIALELPDEFRRETAAVARVLAQACEGRFVPYENYHVTLAFLGEVDEAGSERAVAALEDACKGAPIVRLAPAGLGKFGRPTDSTLWMGLAAAPELEKLAACVRERLNAADLPYDEKPFRPHITLARRARLPKGKLPELLFPEASEASRVTLFKSTLDPAGAIYKPLHTVELGEAAQESGEAAQELVQE